MNYTYPGVYIVELPSSVHNIVGVATSIGAFVGYTASGIENTAVELFNWGDFVRNFGGLASNSELSYAVQQFFANGGTHCFVVRIPRDGAKPATLVIGDNESTPKPTLTLNSISSGSWSQTLIVEVDYDNISTPTINLPGTITLTHSASLVSTSAATASAVAAGNWVSFNADPSGTPYQILSTTAGTGGFTLVAPGYGGPTTGTGPGQFPAAGWSLLVGYDPTAFNLTITDTGSGKSESFANVSMSPTATNFAQTIVNDPDNGSQYVRVASTGANPPQITGFVAVLPGDPPLGIGPGLSGLSAWLQGPQGPVVVTNGQMTVAGSNFLGVVNANQQLVFASDTSQTVYTVGAVTNTQLTLTHPYAGGAAGSTTTTTASTATPSGAASFVLTPSLGGAAQSPVNVTLWPAGTPPPTSQASLLRLFSIATTRALQARYPGAQVTTQAVSLVPDALADSLQITVSLPNNYDAVVSFAEPSPPPAAGAFDIVLYLGLTTTPPSISNVARYYFAHAAVPEAYQLSGGVAPADAPNLPTATDIIGSEAAPGPGGTLIKTGIYALDKVDLFNILCIPDATRAASGRPNTPDLADSDINAIYSAAMDYCKRRRAFLIVDSPPDVNDVASAINWRSNRLVLNDANGAVYFPRVMVADPLNQNNLRAFAPSGTMAGIYGNEDANRKVWKAPAGIETNLAGVQKLTYNLTDDEQGVLNPIALNCLRNFPIYGPVAWGARTLVGADQEASQWKYLSVRRFALYLEESLYRGLKWVVFEPNAAPLWGQIRLTVTSFMQTLFLQGAFQGQTPSTAYFVQCDSSTTTQADIDSGIVNIVVGFAPLLPAEFVVLQLQQMAGQVAV
jgi:phage tail sheath protein FI